MLDSAVGTQTTEQDPSPSSSVELKYPTINLCTSYESLLSNSSISSHTTAKMTRSQQPSMEDSWAALQPSDYANDDDQHSDIVDTGSLVDLSSTHDNESILGDETPSESDLGGDAEDVITDSQPSAEEGRCLDQSRLQENDFVEDTIILQQSDVQPCDDSIALEYTMHSSGSSRLRDSCRDLKEQITMTISSSILDTKDQPFHVAYYGSPENSAMKEELLGKIGAAIVLPLSSGNAVNDSTSSLYNIVPTEFGPGSKPTFAGLMPSHAQMSVEDIKLSSDNLEHLRISSKKGIMFDSGSERPSNWRPDLLVVHIDRRITQDDVYLVNKIIKFTELNAWPTLVVTRYDSGDFCPQAPGSIARLREIDDHGSPATISQAIDLDSFVVIDTEQINRHLKFLAERSQAHIPSGGTLVSMQRLWKTAQGHFNQQKTLVSVNTESESSLTLTTPEHHQGETKPGFWSQIKESWVLIAGRQTLKDTVLSVAVMLLGLYIVSFSQGLTQSTSLGSRANISTTTAVTNPTIPTTTAAIPVRLETPSKVPSIDQDIMVYEPISFDQVWSRLTGKSHDNGEKKDTEMPKGKQIVCPRKAAATPIKVIDEPPKTASNFMNILNGSRNALERLKDRLEARMADIEARTELKKAKQAQIEEMNQKILDFWADIPQNLQVAGRYSHERYQELVRKSQKHIRRAKWATGKRLEELVGEQKKLLSRAQLQANILTREVPRRKRTALFKKGEFKYGRFWR